MSCYKTKSNTLRIQRELSSSQQLNRKRLTWRTNKIRLEIDDSLDQRQANDTEETPKSSNDHQELLSRLKQHLAHRNLSRELSEKQICASLEHEIMLVARKNLLAQCSETLISPKAITQLKSQPLRGMREVVLTADDISAGQPPQRLNAAPESLGCYRKPYLVKNSKKQPKPPELINQLRDCQSNQDNLANDQNSSDPKKTLFLSLLD